MSSWIEIKDQEDVELSGDGKTIEVLYSSDHHGNNYIDIPVEFVKSALKSKDTELNIMKTTKQELIDFLKWFHGKFEKETTPGKIVDDYLNSQNNENKAP